MKRSGKNGVIAAALLCLTAAGLALAPLAAQENTPLRTLTPGNGADLTSARCGICHDVTHITRGKLSRGEWQDNVRNMLERGAPIDPSEVPVIIDYLATYYNRDAEAPPPEAAPAGSDPVQRLLAAHACSGCHGVSQKIVGPSFREIAARYAGDKSASTKLGAKVKNGGAGNWGTIPMPAHTSLSDAELAQLVGWILTPK